MRKRQYSNQEVRLEADSDVQWHFSVTRTCKRKTCVSLPELPELCWVSPSAEGCAIKPAKKCLMTTFVRVHCERTRDNFKVSPGLRLGPGHAWCYALANTNSVGWRANVSVSRPTVWRKFSKGCIGRLSITKLKESVSVQYANWEKWNAYRPRDRRNGTGCVFHV